jgi:hypothetical protein
MRFICIFLRCGDEMVRSGRAVAWILVAAIGGPVQAFACACGCGEFDVGNLFSNRAGGSAWFEYGFMDQNRNRHGLNAAPADADDDKDIRTNFFTLGGEYLFADGFGVMVELPYWSRHFETADDGAVHAADHAALGDIRLTAAYSGFFEDRGTGVTLGVKLPSGDFTYPGFDRDTAIGTGSADLMAGLYHRGNLDAFGTWRYFSQARYQWAIATQGGYRPGDELNAIVGISYDAGKVGALDIAPLLQVIGSIRQHDSGLAADTPNTGYSRVLLSPGVDVGVGNWIVHAEADLPVYENVVGNQLTAPVLVRASIAYEF